MKKTYLNSFCARCLTLLVLALLSTNLAWGTTIDLSESLDLTGKTVGCSSYSSSTVYGNWTIVNGANNNKGWAYFKMGGKSATISSNNPCYIYYSANSGVSRKVDKIVVHIVAGSLSKSGMSVNSWGVYVYSDKAMTTQVDYVSGGTITNEAADFEFTPSAGKTWAAGYYYKVSWDLANTSDTNGIVWLDKITLQSINDAPEPVLQSIAISGTPDKTTYEAGEEFDPAGLVVTGTYTEGDPQVITSGIDWTITPNPLTAGTTSVSVTAKVGEITSAAYQIEGLIVTAALPKITIDGNASGITTNDETQSITVSDFEFGGYFKQYATTALWFTDGSGFIYNKESFGKIRKITINYKNGGSPSAYQYIRLGNTILGSYSETTTNGVKYETSTGGSSNTFIVTGDYEYFCISIDNKNLQASSIVVEYEEAAPDTRAMPTASFENEIVNAVVNDNFTITVTTNSDGAVTYSSNDDDVAMVDQSTGEVLAISAGTATITANIAGTETYKPASASYTVVIASAPLTGKGTEAEPYTIGDIIALGSNGEECWVSGIIVGFGVSEQQPDKSYKLGYTTDTEKFLQSNFVISDGSGHIAAVELPSGSDIRTALNLPEHLNYIGAPIKVYGTLTNYFSQVGVKSTSNYKLTQQDVTISSAGWATACLPFNATISGNATAYYVSGTEGNALTKVEANVIPAGEGILLKSNEGGEATVKFTETIVDADAAATDNLMKGSLEGETFNAEGYKYYILANDGTHGLGFYYQVEDGVSATCAAGKAVLAVPTTSGAKAFFSLDNEPTGIESLTPALSEGKGVYNLNGLKVNEAYKGIVIMNGKKYINK